LEKGGKNKERRGERRTQRVRSTTDESHPRSKEPWQKGTPARENDRRERPAENSNTESSYKVSGSVRGRE